MNVKRTKLCLCRSLLLMTGLLFAVASFAQDLTVKGKVTDTTGETVIGANVTVKGTTNGVITDIDGNYTLSGVKPSSVLVFSFIGYKTQEIPCSGRQEINVVLSEDAQALDEVVVVGYGSLSKKELSSSIVQVDRSKFLQGSMNNPMEMLTGKVAGLTVNNTAAANPNASSSLQIRGATSISASNDPLVVIDGVAGGDIRNLAAQDIESMTVLKDAASAAIYGTRGANGVILITTRKGAGEAGRAQVTYDSWFGVNLAKSGPDILSADEFRRSRRATDYGYSTDWYDLLLRDFSYDNNQYLSIDGSTKNGYYGASFNYKKATGLDLNSSREEFGGRFVLNQRMMDGIVELNGSLNARRVNEVWGNDGMFDTALSMNPTMPLYNEDGTYFQPTSPTGARNPVQELKEIDNNGQRVYLLGTAEVKVNLIRSEKQMLNTSLSYSLHYNDLKQHYYTPSTAGESYWNGYNGRAEVTYQKWYTSRLEWLGNYSLDLGDHNFKAMVGYNYEQTTWERLQAGNSDFNFDDILWNNLGSGSYLAKGKASMGTGKSLAKLIGVFGRINYNFNEKYMASVILRTDGSSNFARGKRWGTFPSVSAGWVVSNEDFMESTHDWMDFLKIRASWGQNGNCNIDNFQYFSTVAFDHLGQYSFGNNKGTATQGGYASIMPNEDVTWETSEQLDLGLDARFLSGRLSLNFDWYNKKTKDLLIVAPILDSYGTNAPYINGGTVENKGVEIGLGWNDQKGDWTYGVNLNLAHNKNEVTQINNKDGYILGPDKVLAENTRPVSRMEVGHPIGYFWAYKTEGVMQNADDVQAYLDKNCKGNAANSLQGSSIQPGDLKFVDVNGDGVINEDDKTEVGNPHPDITMGLSFNVGYKGFDLAVTTYGAFGQQNMRSYRKFTDGNVENYTSEVFEYWHGEGTSNRYPRLVPGNTGVNFQQISDIFVEDASYFRIQNVTLGYDFKNLWKNCPLPQLRLYVSAQNLFTFTGYKGMDPEIGTNDSYREDNPWARGIDLGSYPSPRTYMVGVNIKF